MAAKFKNTLIWWFGALLYRLIVVLPRGVCLFCGEQLGRLVALVMPSERRRAEQNVRAALGTQLSTAECRRISRDCFVMFGRSGFDAVRMRSSYAGEIKPSITVRGEEHFRTAYERGRGIIAFTGHIGNFELLAAYCAQSGYKTAVIARQLWDKRIDNLVVTNRRAMDIVNIPTSSSPKVFLRYLNDGYAIGCLIDSHSFRVTGEMIPFFHKPARVPIGPTRIGLAAGAAFVPLFCLSYPGGKYEIVFGEEIVPESYDRSRENIYRLTCKMTKVIENMIRDHPEQWFWMHNRWKSGYLPGEKEFLESIGEMTTMKSFQEL
jgi:KDO2-lipid IV(A) lauroyltransferase